jgi:hypothetical protein
MAKKPFYLLAGGVTNWARAAGKSIKMAHRGHGEMTKDTEKI